MQRISYQMNDKQSAQMQMAGGTALPLSEGKVIFQGRESEVGPYLLDYARLPVPRAGFRL